MTPDPLALGRLLLRVEGDAHRLGWDNGPARLYVLYDQADAQTEQTYRRLISPSAAGPGPIRCGPYTALSMIPPSMLNPRSVHALFRLAASFTQAPTQLGVLAGRALARLLGQPGFLGLALLAEGWAYLAKDGEPEPEPGRSLADTVGSKEYRGVIACDVAMRDYWVRRIRGQSPELVHFAATDETDGAIIESLRSMVAAVAGLPVPALRHAPHGWVERNVRERPRGH